MSIIVAEEERIRALLSLLTPDGAAPELALLDGVDAAFAGDLDAVEKSLRKAGDALGWGRADATAAKGAG